MRIGINARLLLPNKLEGIGRFTFETLKRITQAHPEHEFYFFFDRPFSDEFVFGPNVKPIVLFPQARHPFLYYWFFHISMHKAIKKYSIDLLLSTDGYLSLPAKIPQVQVIHDLAFLHFKQGISKLEYWYYTTFFPKYAQLAKRIVTVSEYTKQDIVGQFHINPTKIDVVYNAPSAGFKAISEAQQSETRNEFAEGAPYFCYVGAMHPRKNIETLLKSFDAFKTQTKHPHKLVIVGRKAWQSENIEQAYANMHHQHDVIFTGRVSEADLYRLTASAFAMVYIPYFEGFGLPIVEAMACEVPVITSNVTSMPEVAADAGVLVSPHDAQQITQAMINLVENSDFYQQKKLASAKRKGDFSWDKSAQQLWDSMMQAYQPN